MMRLPFYLACAAFVAAARGDSGGDPPSAAHGRALYSPSGPRQLQPLDLAAPEDGPAGAAYALPRWAAKYRPQSRWAAGVDPRFYLLAEMENNEEPEYDQVAKQKAIRNKRYNLEVYQPRQTRYFNMEEEPSLSINAPIQSLRKVYAKERLRQRIAANRIFLDNLRDSQ